MENEMKFDLGESWFTNAPLLAKVLGRHFKKENPLCFMEIGSWKGRSAIWFLENYLIHPESKLFCIDTWDMQEWNDFNQEKRDLLNNPQRVKELQMDTIYQQFLFNIKFKGFQEKCIPLRNKSELALKEVKDEYFDFVYVDGDHSYQGSYQDFTACWPKLKKGGILFGDDWSWSSEEGFPVKLAARQFAKENGLSIKPFLGKKNGFYVIKK
jgi:predicted O-methyltransferase YrrM